MAEGFKHSYKVREREDLPLAVYNVGFQKCGALYQWGPGVRDHYLIHHIVSGKGIYQAQGEEFALGPGDTFLVYPDTRVLYRADGSEPWEYYWVGFGGSSAGLFLEQTDFRRERPVLAGGFGTRLRQALLDIYKARGSDSPSAVRMAGYLQAALGLLMAQAAAPEEDPSLAYAIQGARHLEYNFSREVTVEEAAQAVGISRSHLYRVFQGHFGQSPKEYLTQYRIARACTLLRRSQLPIGVVATSVGFEDHLYFTRVFRRLRGCSPTQWRWQSQGGALDKGAEV